VRLPPIPINDFGQTLEGAQFPANLRVRLIQDHPGNEFRAESSRESSVASIRSASERAPFCARYRFEVKCEYVPTLHRKGAASHLFCPL
jgi:hypothetical protein